MLLLVFAIANYLWLSFEADEVYKTKTLSDLGRVVIRVNLLIKLIAVSELCMDRNTACCMFSLQC